VSVRKILVTGGAGFIGSVATSMLLDSGFEVNVLDDLSTGHASNVDARANFILGSILEPDLLGPALENCDLVMHFAAKALVGESVIKPEEYRRVNIDGSISLLEGMVKQGVSKIVFSSSCATYGEPRENPISEESSTSPVNPYGASKLAIDQLLAGEYAQYVASVSLRYFNVGGAFKSRSGWLTENHSPETHLIPNVLSASSDSPVKVFGTKWETKDGTCVRDFVHVVDLIEAHIKAMNVLQSKGNIVINVGSGIGYSVAEVINAVSEVTGKKVPFINVEPRPGDPPRLIADIKKAKSLLDWTPTATLNQIIQDTYLSRQESNFRS
jgi:UDP-glucose 4-epimerase